MPFHDQIKDAKRSIKALKDDAPYMFPEWVDLQQKRTNFERAKKELDEAIAAWHNLGE